MYSSNRNDKKNVQPYSCSSSSESSCILQQAGNINNTVSTTKSSKLRIIAASSSTSMLQNSKNRLEGSSSQIRNPSSCYDHRQDRVLSCKRNVSEANRREDVKHGQRTESSWDTSWQFYENIEDVQSNIDTMSIPKVSTSGASETTDTQYVREMRSHSSSLSQESGQREDPRTERRMTSSKATSGVVKKKKSEIKKEISYSRDSSSSSDNVVFNKQTKKTKHEKTQQASSSSKITSLDMRVQKYKSEDSPSGDSPSDDSSSDDSSSDDSSSDDSSSDDSSSDDSSSTSNVSSSNETVILDQTKFTKCVAETAKEDQTTPIGKKSGQIFRVDTDVRTKQVDSPLTVPVKIDITQQGMDIKTQKYDVSSKTDTKIVIKRILNDKYPDKNLVPPKKPKSDSSRSNNNENSNSNNDRVISNIGATVKGKFSKDERDKIKAEEHKKDSKYMPVLLSKTNMLEKEKRKERILDKFRLLFGEDTTESEIEEEHVFLLKRKAEDDDVTKEDAATVTYNLQKNLKTTEKVNHTNDNLVCVADTEDVRPSTNSRTKDTQAKDSKTTTDTKKNEEERSEKQLLTLCQNVTKEIININSKNTNTQDIVQNQQDNQIACNVENTISADNDVETHEGASANLKLSSPASELEIMSEIKRDDTNSCDISRNIPSPLLTSNDGSANDKKYVIADQVSITISTNASQEISEHVIDKEPIISQQEYVDVMDASEKKLNVDAGGNRSSAADAFNDNVNEIETGTDIKPRSEYESATSSLKIPCSSTSTCNTDNLKNHEIARASPKILDEIITPGNINRKEDNSTSIQPSVVEADVTAHTEPSTQQITRDSSPAVENITLSVQQQDIQDSTVLGKDKDTTKDKSVKKNEDVQSIQKETAIEKSVESNNLASNVSDLGERSTETFSNDVFLLSERIWKARMLQTEFHYLSQLSSAIFVDPVTKHISQHIHPVPLASSQSASEMSTNIENTQQTKELLKIKILKMICICIEQCRIFKEYFINIYKQLEQNIPQEMFFAVMQMINTFELYAILLNKKYCYSVIGYIVNELNCHMLKDHPTTLKEIITYMMLNSSSMLRLSRNTDNNSNITQPSNAAFVPDNNPPPLHIETLNDKLNYPSILRPSENTGNDSNIMQPSNVAFVPSSNLSPLHIETLNDKRPQFLANAAYRPTISNINQQQSSQNAGNIAYPASCLGQPITSEVRNEVPPQNVRNILPASIQSLPKDLSQFTTTNNSSMNNMQVQSSRKSDYTICTSMPNMSNSHFNIRRPDIPKNIVHVTEQQSQMCFQYSSNVNSGKAPAYPSYKNQNIPLTSQVNYRQAVPYAPYTSRTSLNLTGNTVERNVVFKNPSIPPRMNNPQAFEQVAPRQCENREYTGLTGIPHISATRTLPRYSELTFQNVAINAAPPPYSAHAYVPASQPILNMQERNLPSTISYPSYTHSSAVQTNIVQDDLANRMFLATNMMQQNVANPQQNFYLLLQSFEDAAKSLPPKSLPPKPLPSKSSLQQTTSSTGTKKGSNPRKRCREIKTTVPTTSSQQDVRQGASAVQNVPHRSSYNAAPSTCVLQVSESFKRRSAPNQPCNVQREISSLETTPTQVSPQQSRQIMPNNFDLKILTDIQKVILRDQIMKYFQMPMTWRDTLTNKEIDETTAQRIVLRHLYNSLTDYTNKIVEENNKMIQGNQMQSSAAMIRLELTTMNKNKENNPACDEKLEKVAQQSLKNNEEARNVSMPIKSNITKKSKDQESHSTLTTEIAVTMKPSSISLQSQDRNTGMLHSDVRSLPDAPKKSETVNGFLQDDKTMQYSSVSRLATNVVETKDISKFPSANSYGKQLANESPKSSLVQDILKPSQDRLAIGVVNIETILEKQLGIARSEIKATVTDNDPLKIKSISRSSVIVKNNNKEIDATSQSPSYNIENQNKEDYNVHDEVANESSNNEAQECKINSFTIEPVAEDTLHASTSSLLKDEPTSSFVIKTSTDVQAKSRTCDIFCKKDITTETLSESGIKLKRCDSIDDQASNFVANETCDSLDREIYIQKSNEKSNSDVQQNNILHIKEDISQDMLLTIDEMKYEPINIYIPYLLDTDTNSINLCQSPVIGVQDTVKLDENLPMRKRMQCRETSPFNVPENISNTKQSNTDTAQLDDITRQCGDVEENLSTHSDIKIDEQFSSESDYCKRSSTSSIKEYDNIKIEDISIENDISESDYVGYSRVKNRDCETVDHIMPSILTVTSISPSLFEKMDDTVAFSEQDLALLNQEKKEEALNNSGVPDGTEDKKCLRCKERSTVCCEVCLLAHYCSERCSQLHWNTHHYMHCKPRESFTPTDDIL